MANTTIQEMYDAVRRKLEERFPQVPIVEDETALPDQTKGFRIKLLQTTHSLELSRRYRRAHTFLIQYGLDPDQTDPALAVADLYGTAELLTDVLEWVEAVGRKMRGAGMQFEVSEQKLKFQVTYSFLNWKDAPTETAMGSLHQEGRVEDEQ